MHLANNLLKLKMTDKQITGLPELPAQGCTAPSVIHILLHKKGKENAQAYVHCTDTHMQEHSVNTVLMTQTHSFSHKHTLPTHRLFLADTSQPASSEAQQSHGSHAPRGPPFSNTPKAQLKRHTPAVWLADCGPRYFNNTVLIVRQHRPFSHISTKLINFDQMPKYLFNG